MPAAARVVAQVPTVAPVGKRRNARDEAIVPGTTCFVCDRVLTPTNGTMEHVVPRWILSKYGLWATVYHLGEGERSYRYDRLKVGACESCNARLGRALEEPMRAAVVDGAELDLDVSRLWLAKMNCGFDAADAANSEARSRLREQVWSANERQHREFFHVERMLLEHAGADTLTIRPSTWSSLFVYETQVDPSEPRANFDYADDPTSGFVAARVGPIGLIGFILDGGFIARGVEFFDRVRACQPLNPMQWREVVARAYAWAVRLRGREVTVDYEIDIGRRVFDLDIRVPREAEEGPTSVDVINRLAFSWGVSTAEVSTTDGQILTSLFDDEDAPRRLEFHERVAMPPL